MPKHSLRAPKERRILWVVEGSTWAGRQNEFVNLALRLPRGWQARLLYLRTPGNLSAIKRLLAQSNIEVRSLGYQGKNLPIIIFRYLKELLDFKPDIVHSHHPPANLLNGFSKALSIVLPVSFQSFLGYRNARRGLGTVATLLERINLLFADLVLCSSRGAEASFFDSSALLEHPSQPRTEKRKHWTVLNSIDLQAPQATISARPEHELALQRGSSNAIVSVAAFKRQKGHETLLTAFAQVHRHLPDAELILLGEGELLALSKRRAQQLRIRDQCHFLGHQPHPELWVHGARLFVLASHWEGLPKSLLEAMALGVPCVATNVEGTREILPEHTLVTPGNPSALAERIEAMLRDPEQRAEQVTRQNRVLHKVDIDKNSRLIFRLYDDLTKTKQS